MTQAEPNRIAFIGGGNMARSLIAGLRQQGYPGNRISVTDPNRQTLDALVSEYGVAAAADANEAVVGAELIVLAVKPQVMAEVCTGLATQLSKPIDADPTITADPIVISIAAGIRSDSIDAWLGGDRRIVRAMPNTPALLGAGATGLYANARCDAGARAQAQQVLDAVGVTIWVDDEDLMDAVTAVSGSGPAYFFRAIEALQHAACEQGLSEDSARTLVLHTALGAARMAIESGEDAGSLRRRVTSPGGTTAAAMAQLDADAFDQSLARAVDAAVRRGRELSESS